MPQFSDGQVGAGNNNGIKAKNKTGKRSRY
jgi:hypothetical protein